MFSGIVELKVRLLNCTPENQNLVRLKIKKPQSYNDIATGDSVAVNGICLTVDRLDNESFDVVVAKETLAVTHWTESELFKHPLNLERSLPLGGRIHGHPVTGHADAMGVVKSVIHDGGSLLVAINFPKHLQKYIWAKGSVAINGVSLTVNRISGDQFEVCLIPETVRRTNLGDLAIGDKVTIEIDSFARGLVHCYESRIERNPTP